MTKSLTILGSTGTIGKNTIKLIESDGGFSIEALTARTSVELLAEQAKTLNAAIAVIEDESKYDELKSLLAGTKIEAACGTQAISNAASRPVDILISGIVGFAGLAPTLAAIRAGTTIGLANKECLVCAGDLMMTEVKKYNAKIIPVDSEHNSLFQSFDFDRTDAIEKLTLTASGGPFRSLPPKEFANITVKQAVAHPNWKMGAKISVDSATMMNKGLEVIEAYHLFPVEKKQLDILVHPESIIHGTVSYSDGSMIAGLSVPDMCVPIAYALGWPKRLKTTTKRLDLGAIGKLTFATPDFERFPALQTAKNALFSGGNAPCTLNAANEVAVEAFLNEKISFLNIQNVVECTLSTIGHHEIDNLDGVFATDKQTRIAANEIINKIL